MEDDLLPAHFFFQMMELYLVLKQAPGAFIDHHSKGGGGGETD